MDGSRPSGDTCRVRFTLNYAGPLRGSGGGLSVHKHELRRQFHPQLRELWQHEPLSHLADRWLIRGDHDEAGGALREVADRTFAVVVRHDIRLTAELDILLLRPEAPGAIMQRADIDNRLKTLFDALRRPSMAQEIPPAWAPAADESPLYCLLDDDRLITRVNVETDRLLAPASSDDVRLTVRVQLGVSSPTFASIMLL